MVPHPTCCCPRGRDVTPSIAEPGGGVSFTTAALGLWEKAVPGLVLRMRVKDAVEGKEKQMSKPLVLAAPDRPQG